MTRKEWLEELASVNGVQQGNFINKEFFVNLTEEDLDEVLNEESIPKGSSIFKPPGQWGNKDAYDYSLIEEGLFKDQDLFKNFCFFTKMINRFRKFLDEPMIITSGLRTKRKHLEIYKRIAKRKGVEFDESKVPMRSAHLKFLAVDFVTKDLNVTKSKITEAYIDGDYRDHLAPNCYFEDLDCTTKKKSPWIHVQVRPPKSGARFFLP